MLKPERLAEMKAAAERQKALQDAATRGPWVDDDGTIRDEHGSAVAFIQPHGNVNTVARTGEHYSKADAEFIAASRTDPSPANVLELAAEVKRLREIVNQHVPLPSVARLFNEPELLPGYLEVHCGNLSSIHSIIRRCHIHGVAVPEHLKPYETEAT